MRRAALNALLSHWRRRPLQFITLVLGLALATGLWSGVQAINAEARASYDRAAEAMGQVRLDQIVRDDGGPLDQSLFPRLRRAGWPVSPVVEGQKAIGNALVTVLGVDPLTAPAALAAPLTNLAGEGFLAFLTPPGELRASLATIDRIGPTDRPLVEDETISPGLVVADIGVAQTLLRMEGRISRFVLPPGVQGTLPLKEIGGRLRLVPASDDGTVGRLADSFHLNLTAFGLLSFAVGLFIVRGAVGLAFEQRRTMVRTLRALGMPLGDLVGLMLAELTLIALVSGAIGTTLGYFIAAMLIPDVAATLRGLYGAPVEGVLSLRPSWWAAGMGIAIAGTLAAAAASLWQVARMPLLASARPRAWAMTSGHGLRLNIGATLALVFLALAAGRLGGLAGGFVMLGCLMVATALMLPVLLWAILRVAERLAPPPLRQWYFADTRQQLPGLSLALMALMLALASNIGVGTMVSSFRLTFTGWLDQRLASEFYVTARDQAEAERLRTWLEARSDAVLPILNTEGSVAGAPAEIYGVADHPTYRDNWPILEAAPDVWNGVASGEAVIINEQLAYREDLVPGDTLTLPGGWQARVGGIYSDYGNPSAQVLVGLDEFNRRYPEAPRLRYGVRVPPAKVEALMAELREDFGLPETSMVDQATLKRVSRSV